MADTASFSSSPDEEQPKFTPTKRQKVERHLKRFWWLYLLILIVVVLAVILPIVYVYYPKKAQSDVNASTIIATSESVTNPTPDSFFYNNTAILEIGSSYNPTLYSWEGSYFLESSTAPFLTVTIPEIPAYNGTEISIRQQVQISDQDEFIKNSNLIFSSAAFSIYLRGTGGLKEGGLPRINVNYDKKIDLVGLNRFQGLEVTEFHILNQSLADGSNAVGNVTLPNPSIFTLEMGNVSLDLSVNGTSIGNATLPNFLLRPGNNSYPLHVTSNQTEVLQLLQLPAYRCGVLPITIQGRHSVVNGQDIPYFSAPLQKYPLTTTLNLVPALQEIGLGSLINGSACAD